jgi:hypothetical protein
LTVILCCCKNSVLTKVIQEKESFMQQMNLASINGANGFGVNIPYSQRNMGWAVKCGDINGDGIDDFHTSAPDNERAELGGSPTGFTVFGKRGSYKALINGFDLNGQDGFKMIEPLTDSVYRGVTVLSRGDFNGDNITDLMMCVDSLSKILFGTKLGYPATLLLDTLTGQTGMQIVAQDFYNQRYYIGETLASGDLNGDGVADVAIGARNSVGSPGTAFVAFGARKNLPSSLSLGRLNGTDGFKINGVAAKDDAGASLAFGDINGDGIADLIIGAPARTVATGTGAYTLFGSRQSWPETIDLSTLNGTSGFAAKGVTPYDMAGTAVASCDVNGDGISDLVIGAPQGGANAGAVHVVFGSKTFPASVNLSSLDGNNGFSIIGINPGDETGFSLSCGDFNGDGIPDLIIGARSAPKTTEAGPGIVYVINGKSHFPATINLLNLGKNEGTRILGTNNGQMLGNSLDTCDVNADGKIDILIGAPRTAFPHPDYESGKVTGAAYAVFGGVSSSASKMDNPLSFIWQMVFARLLSGLNKSSKTERAHQPNVNMFESKISYSDAQRAVAVELAKQSRISVESALKIVKNTQISKDPVQGSYQINLSPEAEDLLNLEIAKARQDEALIARTNPTGPVMFDAMLTMGSFLLYLMFKKPDQSEIESEKEQKKLGDLALKVMKEKLLSDIAGIEMKLKESPYAIDKEVKFMIADLKDFVEGFKKDQTTVGDLNDAVFTKRYLTSLFEEAQKQ